MSLKINRPLERFPLMEINSDALDSKLNYCHIRDLKETRHNMGSNYSSCRRDELKVTGSSALIGKLSRNSKSRVYECQRNENLPLSHFGKKNCKVEILDELSLRPSEELYNSISSISDCDTALRKKTDLKWVCDSQNDSCSEEDFNSLKVPSQSKDEVGPEEGTQTWRHFDHSSRISITQENDRFLCGACPSGSFESLTTGSRSHDATIALVNPCSQQLQWRERPTSVLIVQRVDCTLTDSEQSRTLVAQQFNELACWLVEAMNMTIYVEDTLLCDLPICSLPDFKRILSSLVVFNRQSDELAGEVDLIACLGDDSALLDASALFQENVPPIMAFQHDTHGFLLPLKFSEFRQQVARIVDVDGDSVRLTLHTRLICEISRHVISSDSNVDANVESDCNTERFQIINEVSIERSSTYGVCALDLHIDDRIVSTVQASGLLISTSTGSTGLAAATGSSMMQPSVPSVLITPVCPRSLSFRPIVVPASVHIKVTLSSEARHTVWLSFDGSHRMELRRGDSLSVRPSPHPLPSVCSEDQVSDWFDRLSTCFQWNERRLQGRLDS